MRNLDNCYEHEYLGQNKKIMERYVIEEIIGRGGMGVVYKAIDLRLNNMPVAIKEMNTIALSRSNLQISIEAFKKEASLLISLRHPSLPRIMDFFNTNDNWYLVMDFIEGETLRQIIERSGPIPESLVLDWARQLCEILDYLHNQEPPIIFSDLKPSNIMLSPNGIIKLIDFGISRHFMPGYSLDTHAYGSVGYAPPEQYGNNIDIRLDIYALGATLHHLITGINPGKNLFHFQPPSKTVQISYKFEKAIMKAVELIPENRPSNAKKMLSLLPKNTTSTEIKINIDNSKRYSNEQFEDTGVIDNDLIQFSVEQANAIEFDTDVIAIQYSRNFYGLNKLIAKEVFQDNLDYFTIKTNGYHYQGTNNKIGAKNILILSASPLQQFGYEEIYNYSYKVLSTLLNISNTNVEHLTMTIYDAGPGLDESEVAISQVKGYIDAIIKGDYPRSIKKITIIDIDNNRIKRICYALNNFLSSFNFLKLLDSKNGWTYLLNTKDLHELF